MKSLTQTELAGIHGGGDPVASWPVQSAPPISTWPMEMLLQQLAHQAEQQWLQMIRNQAA